MNADDDPTAQRLLEAVWAAPQSDAARMVYADYLMNRGDPLGELIAMQLERARTGGSPLPREHELVELGQRALPLGPYLDESTVERGFLATAIPKITLAFPPEILAHPAWSTVKRFTMLDNRHVSLFANPHFSLETLCAPTAVLAELSVGERPLACAALTSANSWRPDRSERGLHLGPRLQPVFEHRGAFDRVRAIYLDAISVLDGWFETEEMLRNSRLIKHLEHLDLTFGSDAFDDLQTWRSTVPSASLELAARTTFRIPVGEDQFVCIALDRDVPARGGPRLFLQLETPLSPEHIDRLVEAVWVVGAQRTEIALHDRGDPKQVEERQPGLVDRLRRHFSEVVLVPDPIRFDAP